MCFFFIQKQDAVVCSTFASSVRLGVICVAITAGCLVHFETANAQSSTALTAVYGRGVHAYFSGNTTEAEQLFSQVIQAGSTDPRPYYFRGVMRLSQGRQFEAENDMRIGAAYEARNPGVQHSIGRALQRVQGPARRTLEKFRRQAKLDRVQRGRQRTQQRYEQLNQVAPNVLRQGTEIQLTQPVQPPQLPTAGSGANPGSTTKPALDGSGTRMAPAPNVVSPTPNPAGSGSQLNAADPFGQPAPVTPPANNPLGSGIKPDAAAPTPATGEADPFGELPSPATSNDDPFGESPAPAAEEADPFGESLAPADDAPAPADEDPFGDSAGSSDTADSDPFGESGDEAMESTDSSDEPPADDDPFGESSETAEEDDPFGESTDEAADEAPADDSDPFGGEEEMEDESESEPVDDSSESSGDEFDEDDPFDPFGAAGPGNRPSTAQASVKLASVSADANPSGQLFFALGQWLGSQGKVLSPAARADSSVAAANFELGPSEENSTTLTAATSAAEVDPFGTTELAEEKPAEEMASDDPFADDPFGEN